ncbi:MAG: ABC transporter permease, partial [Bacteroidetes bacterium]|nr:ABC transporter permease [Bacteroidota bacterium]
MNPSPPKYILRFLRWFCREDFLEEIEGDLLELFEQQFKSSPRWASWMFLWRVFHYFRPEFLKPFSTHPIIHFDMFRHNLLISYRSFLRNKTSFLINLGGLSVGLSCALFIFLWVQDEWQMDKFHENDDQLYQVRQLYYNGGANDLMDSSPAPLAKALMEEVPEVELAISAQYDDSFFDGVVVY